MINPLTKVCKQCGSEDVKHDAWAVWDTENQCWELDAWFDKAYCSDCDGECTIIDKEKQA